MIGTITAIKNIFFSFSFFASFVSFLLLAAVVGGSHYHALLHQGS